MKVTWLAGRCLLLSIALLFQSLLPVAANAQSRLRRPLSRNEAPPLQPADETPQQQPENRLFTGAAQLPAGQLPAGMLLPCIVETPLNSKTAHAGDVFRARVSAAVLDDQGRLLVPRDSLIAGRVETVQAAQTRRRPGIIEVSFSELTIGGQRYPLNGMLVPPDDPRGKGKPQLDIDNEGAVRGQRSTTKRTAAFIGGGAGAGALIGAFTTGAVFGAGFGAVIGGVVVLLAKGKQAVVEPGMKIGVELNQPLTLGSGAGAFSDAAPIAETPRPRTGDYENPPPAGYERPAERPRTGLSSTTARPTTPSVKGAAGAGAATTAGATTTTGKAAARPATRPTPPLNTPDATRPASDVQPVNVSNVLAERTADGKLLVSITGQAPTAGWRLAPETNIENGELLIKLKGYPPQGMAAQVISYPAKVITLDDPQRSIQRVIVRGPTTSRSTVPLVRGGGGANTSGGASSGANASTSGDASKETFSAIGTRISDKLDGLVEDYARYLLAMRASDGTYSFEDARMKDRPEAQLLYALDRQAESARVFRGALTNEVARRAARELSNGALQVNRILPNTRVPVEFTKSWQNIEREINQLTTSTAAR